ncbi:MAG TPA: 2-oxo acid dehydrogenase subunit E2 [Anaerolineales bacterium]|jgi:pyruvate/2-oxoglutarate dehydrogenase complex dihydrolipoamide acyltransferase (E2) component|nr:2-oxo acid dehydrogenase subunit E2 [Anaerolineales bacterium]
MNHEGVIEFQKGLLAGAPASKMKEKPGYRVLPFTMNRRMVAASATVGREQNNIQAIIEVDISEPRRFIREYRQRTGERPSLTAYVAACLARAISEYPYLNSFRKGRNLILLDDLTISVMVEREIGGEMVPEPYGIRSVQTKTYRQIHDEIRAAQAHGDDGLGGLSGMTWLRFIPGFLFCTFIRLASHSIRIMERYGTVSITSFGMFGDKNQAAWGIPLVGGATLAVAVGGIVERPCVSDGRPETREHLCLTVTFNHDIVDGAPAARFLKRFSGLLKNGELLRDEIGTARQ